MKKLLLLTLLAGRTSAPAENPTHKAISALLQKNMNDPASYQPARWGKPEMLTVGDSIAAYKYIIKSELATNKQRIESDSSMLASIAKLSYAQDIVASRRASLLREMRERDSLHGSLKTLPVATDTTRLGYYITHAFRAKNKLGALVLDSVEFFVDRAGRVKMHG